MTTKKFLKKETSVLDLLSLAQQPDKFTQVLQTMFPINNSRSKYYSSSKVMLKIPSELQDKSCFPPKCKCAFNLDHNQFDETFNRYRFFEESADQYEKIVQELQLGKFDLAFKSQTKELFKWYVHAPAFSKHHLVPNLGNDEYTETTVCTTFSIQRKNVTYVVVKLECEMRYDSNGYF